MTLLRLESITLPKKNKTRKVMKQIYDDILVIIYVLVICVKIYFYSWYNLQIRKLMDFPLGLLKGSKERSISKVLRY